MADVADLAQLVEQLIRNEQVVGSNPIISSINIADLAQLVEQLIRNEQVVGSNPIISSIEIHGPACGAFLLSGFPADWAGGQRKDGIKKAFPDREGKFCKWRSGEDSNLRTGYPA